MVLNDDFEMQHRSMLQNKVNMQNNVLTKRREQLKHWELSEVNKMTANRKPATQAKVKFQDSDVFLSACISGDEEEVEDLLDKGANINVATIDGAVIDDNLDIVRFLVEHGADIDAQDNEGWTPLHAAVCCGSLPIAKFLCEKGADLTLTNSDKELAVDLAEDDEIRLYLDSQMRLKNVDVEKCREREFTVMMRDCNEWIRTGRYLDNPHPRTGATALHVAASKGYNELIELLIRAGADVNVRDVEGWTPLHAAAHWAEKEACRLLIENGASVEAETYSGQNVLMVADKTVSDYLTEVLESISESTSSLATTASTSSVATTSSASAVTSSASVTTSSASATNSSASPSPTISATVMFRKNSANTPTQQPAFSTTSSTTSSTTTATFSVAPSTASCSTQQSQMRKANFGGETVSQATSGSTPSTPTFTAPWPPVHMRPSVTRSGSVNSGFVASMASKMSGASGAEETSGVPPVGRRLLKQTISTSAKISAKVPPQQQPSPLRQETVSLPSCGGGNVAGGSAVASSSLQQRPSFLIRSPMTTMISQAQPFTPASVSSTTAATTLNNNNNNTFGLNGGLSSGGSGSSTLQLSTSGFSISSQTPPTQPSSHMESEAERKAKSRLQRHSRRSTQGVTLEQIGEAARQASASSSSVEKEDVSERTKTSGSSSSSFVSSGRRNCYHNSTTPTGVYHHHYQNHQGGGAVLTSNDFNYSTAVPPTSSSINSSSGPQKKDSAETLTKNNVSNNVESAGSVGSMKNGAAAASESSSDNAMEERAYRLLYETECQTSERLRKRVEDLSARMVQMTTSTSGTRGGAFSAHGSTMDDQERRAFERRIAALEYELERSKQVQLDYEKLKDENMALIRVLKKLSK